MSEYIITLFDGEKEIALLGLPVGQSVNLDLYHCRHIHPKDWHIFKGCFHTEILDPEITSFLDMGYEVRIYRKKET